MSWMAYRVVFRLMSPLHVGHLKIGNLMRTRPYVPAKTLWGALTARLTRDCPDLGGFYQQIGQCVNQELAFSYFYPALNPDHPLYPNYTAKGLRYGPEGEDDSLSPDEFNWRLLSSYASTALNTRQASAEEGSLHEVEYISPRDKETGASVYLVGYVFEHQGCDLRWREVLSRLQLGGERRYGWGQVRLQQQPQPETHFFGYELELNNDRPTVRLQTSQPILAHAIAQRVEARGQIELFVGRETQDARSFGKVLGRAQICWAPGAQVPPALPFRVGAFGLWEPV